MGHREPAGHGLVRGDVDDQPVVGFAGPPAAGFIGGTECRHERRAPGNHGQAVEVAAVFWGKGRDESGSPARHETVLGIDRCQAREPGVHEPQLAARVIGHVVDRYVSGDVAAKGEVARIVRSGRLELGGHRRLVAVLDDLPLGSHGQAVGADCDAHRARQESEVGVDHPVVVAQCDQTPALIRRDEETDPRALQERRHRRRVHAVERLRRRSPGAIEESADSVECVANLGALTEQWLDVGPMASPLVGVGRGEGVSGVGQLPRLELPVPWQADRRTHRRHGRLGGVDQIAVSNERHPIGIDPFQVVEQDRRGRRPLPHGDLGERSAAKLTPPRREHQGPRRAVPTGQLWIGDESSRRPRIDHRGDLFARFTHEVDVVRVGKDAVEERHPKGVLRRLLDQAQPACIHVRPTTVTVDDRSAECSTEPFGDVRGRRSGIESVRVEPVGGRVERGLAFDERVALAADRPGVRRGGQQLEQQRAARPRWAHDEHRPLEPRLARR